MDASHNLELPSEAQTLADNSAQETGQPQESLWTKVRSSTAFWPGVALSLGFLVAFWPLLSRLPDLWLGEDGYYSHGFLVPLIAGYVVYRWWPRLQKIKANPSWLAVVPLLLVLWVTRAAMVNGIDSLGSACLVATLLFAVAFVAGWRWMLALSLPIIYLAFALPVWNMAITTYTNPL